MFNSQLKIYLFGYSAEQYKTENMTCVFMYKYISLLTNATHFFLNNYEW